MSIHHARHFAVLEAIALRPLHHFELQPDDRRSVGRLWLSQLVRLRRGDVWELSPTGKALLSRNVTLH